MEMRVVPLMSSSHNHLIPPRSVTSNRNSILDKRNAASSVKVYASKEEKNNGSGKGKGEANNKQSLFTNLTDALDFSQVRSEKDAELLYEAREATKGGGRMTREQYGALRRKIGGTYQDFFKSFVDVEGEYVEEGWVDKTCKVCKKDTRGEPRQVDKFGKYVHVACLERSKSTNFFSRLFAK